jgi:PAS domain S-box-containing protein
MKTRTPIINKDESRLNPRGETVYILTTKAPLSNMQGEVIGLVGVTRDITDRRLAEKAQQDSEKRYRILFQTAGDAIFIMKDDLFLDCNEMTMRMFNGRQDQIIGRHPYELSPPRQPDGRDSMEKALEKIGSALRGEPQRFEWVHRRIDGSDFDAEVTLNVLPLEDGIHLLAFVRDITSRKRSERALEAHAEQLRKTCVATVDVIAMAVESRDAYTSGHQKRVAELAKWIAMEMALPPDQVDGIQMAGLVHDLGKISVPAEILSRPRELSTHEYALIKIHPQTGYDILKNVDFPWPIAEIVYQHHERLDGSGYPRGLKGEEVRLEARILAVADVVEAISSHRPYRPAHSVATAMAEIESRRGTLYDPAAVDACLRLFREKSFVFQSQG